MPVGRNPAFSTRFERQEAVADRLQSSISPRVRRLGTGEMHQRLYPAGHSTRAPVGRHVPRLAAYPQPCAALSMRRLRPRPLMGSPAVVGRSPLAHAPKCGVQPCLARWLGRFSVAPMVQQYGQDEVVGGEVQREPREDR